MIDMVDVLAILMGGISVFALIMMGVLVKNIYGKHPQQ